MKLSYTKFKWNLDEDFTRFHRPDIQSLFDQERELIRKNKEQDLLRNENLPLASSGPNISVHSMGNMTLNYPDHVKAKAEELRR